MRQQDSRQIYMSQLERVEVAHTLPNGQDLFARGALTIANFPG